MRVHLSSRHSGVKLTLIHRVTLYSGVTLQREKSMLGKLEGERRRASAPSVCEQQIVFSADVQRSRAVNDEKTVILLIYELFHTICSYTSPNYQVKQREFTPS